MRDQSGCRAAFGAPPASSVPAGGGPGLPLKGTCGCVEGSRSPLVCGCGKSVPGAGLSQDAAGDASGAKSRRVETGRTLALNVLTAASWAFLPPLPLPSSPAPGHDPAGLSVSRNTWPFPELRRLNSCSPPRLPTAAVPSAWLFTGQPHSPLLSRLSSLCSNVSHPVLPPRCPNRSTLVRSQTQLCDHS